MTTLPVHFICMDNMPPIEGVTSYTMPKPLNHPDDSNKIIIPSNSLHRCIYELDLISNKLKCLTKYDRIQIQNVIIMFNQILHQNLIIIHTKSCYIENKNEFHIIGTVINLSKGIDNIYKEIGHQIWRFDKNGEMMLVSWQPLEFELDSELIYVPFQEKLIALRIADFCIEIWECKLNASNQNDLQWNKNGIVKKIKQYDSILRFGTTDVILGFENILFIFYFDVHYNLDIWCYHLLHQKSYKSKHKVSKIVPYHGKLYVIKDSNNNAHILDFVSGKHIKIDIFELIPNELKKAHEAFYGPLVMGYSKKTNLPIVLKKLILKFYPL